MVRRSSRLFSVLIAAAVVIALLASPFTGTLKIANAGTLLTGLEAYWKLDEASGSRADSADGHTLADNNTVTQNPGILTNAAQFTSANSESLNVSDSSALSGAADKSFSWVGWVYLDSTGTNRTIYHKGIGNTNTTREYRGWFQNSVSRFECQIGNGTTVATAVANTFGAPSTGTWYFFACVFDNTNNTISISVNNGAADSVAATIEVQDTAGDFRLGSNDANSGEWWNGRLDGIGVWSKALSSAELTLLYNSGAGCDHDFQACEGTFTPTHTGTATDTPTPTDTPTETSTPTATATTPPLNSSLVAYWKLDEANGTRLDELNGCGGSGCDLTDVNNVTQAGGILGSAAQFTAANSTYLNRADDADLSTGDIDFSIAAWVYLDTKTADMDIISKWDHANNQREYQLYYQTAADRFAFQVTSNGISSSATVVADNFGSVSTGSWYLVIAWHNSINNEIGISINNGTPNTGAWSLGVLDGTSDFRLGVRYVGQYFDGREDEVCLYKKVLTASERALLLSGVGCNYASELTPTPSNTPTQTSTATETPTPSDTPTTTETPTDTDTPTPGPTPTSSDTPTPSDTPTATATATITPTRTNTPTPTITRTPPVCPTDDSYSFSFVAPQGNSCVRIVRQATFGEIYIVAALLMLFALGLLYFTWKVITRWISI